jgi:peptide/nickel transport system permease protein
MPPLLRFLLNRLLMIPATLLVVTAVIYGAIMLSPPHMRATLYMSAKQQDGLYLMSPEQIKEIAKPIVARRHLDAPYPVQYGLWLVNILQGDWGYGPSIRDQVLPYLLRRSPVTAELTLYSLLFFIPLGLFSGVLAASRKDRGFDRSFRLAAYCATAVPPLILAALLLSIFYVGINWFPPERLSTANNQLVQAAGFHLYTGLITLDGLLNRRPDIALDAARRLVLPVITVSLLHWATLARVTRTTMLDELQKEYVIAARARGVSERALVWRYAFRNTLAPALNSSALSASSLLTGILVVERLFAFHGISDIFNPAWMTPDAPVAMGFIVYCVFVVAIMMFIFDLLMAILDPLVRAGVLSDG